jgi:hypothetical protein
MMASAEALAQDDLADAPERGREMTATMQTMRNFIGEQLARVLTSAG